VSFIKASVKLLVINLVFDPPTDGLDAATQIPFCEWREIDGRSWFDSLWSVSCGYNRYLHVV
jgi:hypothetical protein